MIKLLKFTVILLLSALLSGCINSFAVMKLNDAAQEYLELDDIQNAISRLESSIELDSKQTTTRYLLIDAYLRTGQCENALEHVVANLQEEKNEPSFYLQASQVYYCVASSILNKELNVSSYQNSNNIRAARKYVHNLEQGNINLEKYYDLAPTVENPQSIVDTLKENKNKLIIAKNKYNIKNNDY